MKTMSVDGLTLYFDEDEGDAVELVRPACQKSAQLLHECWGLETPEDCRVYIMTSWLHFVFHSATWPWRILLAVSLPLWYFRVQKLWEYAGGWVQRYGRRRAVGVKPPRLMQAADRSIGQRIFVQEEDIGEKVRHVTCHELAHAFTAHLKLPMWLNEGLAMLAVDMYFGRPTVQRATLDVLAHSSGKTNPGRYRKLRITDQDSLVYHYVRGYWLTRFIEDTRPGLLEDVLSQPSTHKALENQVAAAFGMETGVFWREVDGTLVSFFKETVAS